MLCCVFAVLAQRVVLLAPDKTDQSRDFAWALEQQLIERLQVVDSDIGNAVLNSVRPDDAYNMTTEMSKRLGSAIGCGYMIIIRSAIQRRSAFQRSEYYEAYAAIYTVSSRTGRLVDFQLKRFEADKPEKAKKLLDASVEQIAKDTAALLKVTDKKELAETEPSTMEEPPDENSPLAKNFKAPVPFRRIKPEYTDLAALYEIAATVEITVDLDAAGKILRTEITRWAGYGLDESVEKAVRDMTWRAAERAGRFLPMRFFLRYNFKKVPKE